MTVPFMKKIQIPPNWSELVEKSRELVTEERFNLENNWLFTEADSGNNASIPESSPILQQSGNFVTNATTNTIPTVYTIIKQGYQFAREIMRLKVVMDLKPLGRSIWKLLA